MRPSRYHLSIYDEVCCRQFFYPHDPRWMSMFRSKWNEFYDRQRPDYPLEHPYGR